MSREGRWARGLVLTAMVLATLPWAPPFGNLSAAGAPAPQQTMLYFAPVTGSGGGKVPPDSVLAAVLGSLAHKYPCATVNGPAALAARLSGPAKNSLLGATTPSQELNVLENVPGSLLSNSNIVMVSYSAKGGQYTVTMAVFDPLTDTFIDVTYAGPGGLADVPGLAKAAAGKLDVGLCQSYWDGSITVITKESLRSRSAPSFNGLGTTFMSSTTETEYHVTLAPPLVQAQTGSLDQPAPGTAPAGIVYVYTYAFKEIDRQGYLDNCQGALRNLTESKTQETWTKGTDEWADDVAIGVDLPRGTYSVQVPGEALLGETTSMTTYTGFSRAPCTPPLKPVPVHGNVKLNADGLELKGQLDPSDPYVINIVTLAPLVPTPGSTKSESGTLVLRNPPGAP